MFYCSVKRFEQQKNAIYQSVFFTWCDAERQRFKALEIKNMLLQAFILITVVVCLDRLVSAIE